MGVIGLGRFGALHARVLAQLPQVELVGICSRSEERVGEVAATCGEPRPYTDPAALLAAPDIDAVDIVTEVDRHTEIALAAMERGKHVFCEILVTPSPREMDALAQAARTSDVVFMPGFLERFDVRRAGLRQKAVEGSLGRLVSLYGRRNIWRGILDEPRFELYPLILQPGIHTIDQLLWIAAEEVREVYARGRGIVDPARPDTWWAMLTFESGLLGVIEQSWFVPNRQLNWCDVRLEIVGTSGTAQIKEPGDATWIWTEETVEAPDTYLAPEVHGRISGALEAELAHFASCIAQGRAPLCTLQDAHEALAVGLAIVESAERGAPVSLGARS